MSKPGNETERSRTYWETRYTANGVSRRTPEDVEWKVIDKYIPHIDNVLDVGCGDLTFWTNTGRNCNHYVGLDISPTIIDRNRRLMPHWSFIASPAETYIKDLHAENVLCFDLIFHILEKENFDIICENLRRYSTKRVVVSAWLESPFLVGDTDGRYQRYFNFDEQFDRFLTEGFHCIQPITVIRYDVRNYSKESGTKPEVRKAIYVFERVGG